MGLSPAICIRRQRSQRRSFRPIRLPAPSNGLPKAEHPAEFSTSLAIAHGSAVNRLLNVSLAGMKSPTPTLTVRAEGSTIRLEAAEGRSVRELLDTTELRVRAACGGTGACGACSVRLLSGETNGLTVAEYMKLTPEDRASGIRLACQLRLKGDAEILVEDPAPQSAWKSIPPEDLAPGGRGLPDLKEHIYGVAADLGTSHIRVSLWDRRNGRRIAARVGPNPQGNSGADILNRLSVARNNPERARELGKLARTAIIQAVRDMLTRDVGEVKPMLAAIGRLMVVGNTAMLALLTGRGYAELLDPDSWQRPVDYQPLNPAAWQAEWFMPNVEAVLPPPVAGFIGSDLTAGLLATGLTDGPPGSLLLDVGTNVEIALWDGRVLYVTSVPGGPAFEGAGISRGMSAEPGAIFRVRCRQDGGFECEVIGGGEPKGFCGSGLVDAIAALVLAGRLKPSGRFAVPPGAGGFQLLAGTPRTAITSSDAGAFQEAKAATAAGIAVLLHRAGMAWPGLRRLCVCGAFGSTLDAAHAQLLGLLPPIAPGRVELHGNAALAGCERALLSADGEALFSKAAANRIAINMPLTAEFCDLYMENLRLRPIPNGQESEEVSCSPI
jgi:uncharacterized 2Fe-2S/4Fe-4S cluster protein (DUF4445 family)